jgi:hypothetical protein
MFLQSDITGQQGNISFPATLSKVYIVQIIREVVRMPPFTIRNFSKENYQAANTMIRGLWDHMELVSSGN